MRQIISVDATKDQRETANLGIDYDDFINRATAEIEWLEEQNGLLDAVIPTIDDMTTLTTLRAVIKGLAENTRRTNAEMMEIIKSLCYLA